MMRRFLADRAAKIVPAAALCLAVAGCSGVSAPTSGGPPALAGGPGFTNAASTQLWLRQFGTGNLSTSTPAITATTGLFNAGDILTGVAADANGSVAVSGYTFGAFPGFSNPNHAAEDFVAKFSFDGKQLWLEQFGTGASDCLNAIAVDAAGDIYAAGFTTGAFPGATNPSGSPNAIVVKLDPNGTQLWLRQFSSGTGIDIRSIASGENGALLVAGVLTQKTEQPTAGEIVLVAQQAFVAKLSDSTGQTFWQQAVGQSGIAILNAIASDAQGNAFVAGETDTPAGKTKPGPLQSLAMKLASADGSTVWNREAIGNSGPNAESLLEGIAIDPQGNAVVSGLNFAANAPFSLIAKLNGGDGRQMWLSRFGGGTSTFADNVAVDAAGNVLVAGTTYAALLPSFVPITDDVFLAKFNADGASTWLQQFGTGNERIGTELIVGPLPSSNAVQVAADAGGNAILGGITASQFPGFRNPNRATEAFVSKFGP